MKTVSSREIVTMLVLVLPYCFYCVNQACELHGTLDKTNVFYFFYFY